MTEVVLDIIVSPKSSRSRIIIEDDDKIRVYLHSPPADGKANAECISLFSRKLRTAKSNIRIVKGEKSRSKRIAIKGILFKDVILKIRG